MPASISRNFWIVTFLQKKKILFFRTNRNEVVEASLSRLSILCKSSSGTFCRHMSGQGVQYNISIQVHYMGNCSNSMPKLEFSTECHWRTRTPSATMHPFAITVTTVAIISKQLHCITGQFYRDTRWQVGLAWFALLLVGMHLSSMRDRWTDPWGAKESCSPPLPFQILFCTHASTSMYAIVSPAFNYQNACLELLGSNDWVRFSSGYNTVGNGASIHGHDEWAR